MVTTEIVALTHRGAVRRNNEDAISIGDVLLTGDLDPVVKHVEGRCPLLMLADGMGGHAYGGLASSSALSAMLTIARDPFDDTMASAILHANQTLYGMMRERPEVRGMGTTLVGVAFQETKVFHFNVGDSRAYRHCPGRLQQVSKDDVPGRSRTSLAIRTSHTITQSLGGHSSWAAVNPHFSSEPLLARGESILLCSDGLTDMVSDASISKTLDSLFDPRDRALKLFDLAMRAGGHDNISLIIAQVE